MGYTHYWRQMDDLNQSDWAAITEASKRVLNELAFTVAREYDEPDTMPLIDGETIAFNGIGDDGHETFLISRKRRELQDYETKYDDEPGVFDFCKTAQKPYDLAVCAVLLILHRLAKDVWNISSDGETEDWQPALDHVNRTLPDLGPFSLPIAA